MINPAFWPRQGCVLLPKKRRLFSIHFMMLLPMIGRRTSPRPVGRTPGFLFKGTSLHSLSASMNFWILFHWPDEQLCLITLL